jgi:hypothetical protein
MHRDFKELLSAFNEGHVRYLVVGGYAVSLHAEPRATKGLDILVGADSENSKAVYAALARNTSYGSRGMDEISRAAKREVTGPFVARYGSVGSEPEKAPRPWKFDDELALSAKTCHWQR